MSAYLVNPEHIGALAAFAARGDCAIYDWRHANKLMTARKVARELARQNIVSLCFRYPDDREGNRPGPCRIETDQQFVDEAAKWAELYYFRPPQLKPLDYHNMAGCYDYQACESPDYQSSLYRRQITWIQGKAIRMLPGYDESVRDYQDPRPLDQEPNVVAISL